MQRSSKRLPDVVDAQRALVVESGWKDPTERELKEAWNEVAGQANKSHQQMTLAIRKDNEEMGRHPDAWVHIAKVTRRKTQSLENVPLDVDEKAILNKRFGV